MGKGKTNWMGVTVVLTLLGILGILTFAFGGAILGAAGLKSVAPDTQTPTPAITNTAATTATAGSCTVPLSGTQSLNIASYDADKPGTQVTGIGTTVFLNSATGALNPSGNTTQPGSAYSLLVTKGGYTRTYVDTFTTSCTTTSPTIGTYQENLDTAPTVTAYNIGGRTANANSAAGFQALVATSPSTLGVEFTPSALYKHIAGGVPVSASPQSDVGYFAVFMNDSNTTRWDTSGFNLGLNGAPAGSNWASQCVPYNNPGSNAPKGYVGAAPTWIKGVLVYGWLCHGDFSGQSTGLYHMDLTIKPSSQYGAGVATNSSFGLYVVPVEYFTHTITGALSTGASDNLGAAIDNSINASIYID